MAISRFKTSTLAQGLPKYTEMWDQTTVGGVPTTNLVAKYETPPSSGSTWTDTVGSYNISLTSTTYNSGNGGYLSFDGTNSYGDASSFPTLSTANDITFAMWVYPTTLSGTTYGDSKMIMGMSTADPSYLVGLGATKFFINGFTQSGFEVNHGMSVNNWYLLLWTHKAGAGTGKVYVNNSVVSSSVVQLGSNKAQPFSIGRERTGLNTNRFAGRMGSVYYWNKELTATEATQVWNYSRGRFGL
jgi:hypothetical protein